MATTPKLGLTELETGTDGTVIFNALARELEQYAGIAIVLEVDRTSPPAGVEGALYWVAATATGLWATHDNELAWYENGVWKFQALTEGWVIYDQETDQYYYWTGSARQLLVEKRYSISIANPSASEDRTIVNIGALPLEIYEVEAVIVGTTSVTWTLRRDTDRSATGTAIVSAQVTSNATTGDLVTVAHTVPANSFLWLETTALSGTPAELHVTVRGRSGR